MIARLENSSKGVSSSKNEAEEWGVYFARRIADLYSRVPECRNQEYLKKANGNKANNTPRVSKLLGCLERGISIAKK